MTAAMGRRKLRSTAQQVIDLKSRVSSGNCPRAKTTAPYQHSFERTRVHKKSLKKEAVPQLSTTKRYGRTRRARRPVSPPADECIVVETDPIWEAEDAELTSPTTKAAPERTRHCIENMQQIEARSVRMQSSYMKSASAKAAPVDGKPARLAHEAPFEPTPAANDAMIDQNRQRTHSPVIHATQIASTKRPRNYSNISTVDQRENPLIPGPVRKLTNERAGTTQMPQYPLQPSDTALGCNGIEDSQRQGEPPVIENRNYPQASGYVFNPSKAECILHNKTPQTALKIEIPLVESLRGSPVAETKRTRQQTEPYPHQHRRGLLGSEFSLQPADAKIEQSTSSLQNMSSWCKYSIHPSGRLPESTAELEFSRSARILRRLKGTSDIPYPAGSLMSQSSTGFYKWYTNELRVGFIIPVLKFVLPSVAWSKEREFLVAADNESQFQQLKQAIWDTWIYAFLAGRTDPFNIAIELVPFMQDGGLDAWVPKGNNIALASLGGLFPSSKIMDEDRFAARQTGTKRTADVWALRAPMVHRVAALPFAETAVIHATPSIAQACLEIAAPTSADVHPVRSEHDRREPEDGAAKLIHARDLKLDDTALIGARDMLADEKARDLHKNCTELPIGKGQQCLVDVKVAALYGEAESATASAQRLRPAEVKISEQLESKEIGQRRTSNIFDLLN